MDTWIVVVIVVVALLAAAALLAYLLNQRKQRHEALKPELLHQEESHRQEADANVERAKGLASDAKEKFRESEHHEKIAKDHATAAAEAHDEGAQIQERARKSSAAAERHDSEAEERRTRREDL